MSLTRRVSAKSAQHELSHTHKAGVKYLAPLIVRREFGSCTGKWASAISAALRGAAACGTISTGTGTSATRLPSMPCRCRGPCRSASASRDAAGCRRQLTRNSGDVHALRAGINL